MNKLRLGVLGVSGHFIKRIIMPVTELSNVDLVAVASRSELKACETAKDFGISQCFGSYKQLLESNDIDAVYIPLPNHMHAEWIKKAADAGKHILCEKPLSMNTREAQRVVEYCQKKDVYLMEAFMYKYHPQWKLVRDIIRTKNIGNISYIHTSFSYNNTSATNIRNIKEYGGGGLRDIGCYAISVPRFIIGREPVQVVSNMTYHPEFKTDVLTSAILDFGSCRATFNVATGSQSFQRVDIIGTSGSISVHMPFNAYTDVPAKVTVTTSTGNRDVLIEPADQYGLMIESFANAILQKKELPLPVDDAIQNQKVIDAIIESAKSKAWEPVD